MEGTLDLEAWACRAASLVPKWERKKASLAARTSAAGAHLLIRSDMDVRLKE